MLQTLKKLWQSRPATPSRPAATIYTRAGCHLCDDAERLLRRYGFEPRLVDIDSDPALVEKFTQCVPVVEIDGRVRFRGRVNEVLLRRLIHAAERRDGQS